MVTKHISDKDFFIYGNSDKLWIVFNGGVIELKDYIVSQFDFTIDSGGFDCELLGGDSTFCRGQPCAELSLNIIPLEFGQSYDNVDISDFYDIEECNKLSKIIQRKFDKIMEKCEDDKI